MLSRVQIVFPLLLLLGTPCRCDGGEPVQPNNSWNKGYRKSVDGLNRNRIYVESDGEFDVVYTENISKLEQFSWKFKYGYDNTHGVEPTVHTIVDEFANVVTPVVFEVRHHQSQSWTLPLVIGDHRAHREVIKTLCTPPDNGAIDVEQSIEVIVSTKSEEPITFRLQVTLKNIKIVTLNQNFLVTVSPTSPVYFKLGPFQENLSSPYVRLDVNLIKSPVENNVACFSVSLQKPSCPVQDHQNNVQYNGISHTMATTTTMTLHRDDFTEERFLIFVMHHDYSYCNSSQDTWKDQLLQISQLNPSIPHKQLEFVIRESISPSTYVTATVGVSIFFLVISVVFAVIYLKWLQHAPFDKRECCAHPESSTYSSTYNLCFFLFHVKDHTTRVDVSLQNACTKTPEEISKSAHRYFATFWVVSLFYAIPVVQFVLLYQRVLNKTGNEDLCYFNFKCLHPLGQLTAFNHIFSNIAYVMLGILFLFIVFVVSKSRCRRRNALVEKGLFDHNGIYFAMGSALVMEGFMSSFYHVCPTHLNFQFDTSFMYITAMLSIVKIYQSRHPDSNASAVMAFFGMALVVFLGIITAIYQVWWLWMVITVLHVSAGLMFSVHVYSWGDWKLWKFWNTDVVDSPGKVPISEKCKMLFQSCLFPFRPLMEPITGFLVALNILNWAFAVVGHVIFYDSQDIASYLLMLFLLNLTVYSAIYVTLKIGVAKERILWPSWIYFAISVPFWIAGMSLFFKLSATWDRSQAESRELNKECSFLNFYDEHDIWHFLSAFGMFFMFMFFFTLDDGLMEIERDRIKVF